MVVEGLDYHQLIADPLSLAMFKRHIKDCWRGVPRYLTVFDGVALAFDQSEHPLQVLSR